MRGSALRGRVALALVPALLAGCVTDEPTAPTPVQIVVQSVLDPSAHQQWVLVQEASTGQPLKPYGGRCVRGAGVTITTPDHLAMRADAQPDTVGAIGCSAYRVRLDPYGVVITPGATYALEVDTPDGHVVTGTTTVPFARPVDVASAAEHFSRTRDTLRIAFAPAPRAAAHEVRISTSYSTWHRFIDGLTLVPGTIDGNDGSGAIFSPPTTAVTVAAVDANYYDYYRATSDPIGGGVAISRLEGGVGVFGAIVVIQRRTLAVVP